MNLTRRKWIAMCGLSAFAAGTGVLSLVPRGLAADDKADRIAAERKKLQGTWVAVSSEESGKKGEENGQHRLKFDGETFTFMEGDKVHVRGAFKLDPSRVPMEMDIQFQDGKLEGRNVLAIYAWAGEKLMVCATPEPNGRPKDFTTTVGDERILIVLKRQDP